MSNNNSKIFHKSLLPKLYLKIVREKASPKYIASGWALGMACGCLFPIGTQLIVSIPLAFLFRISKIGATLGTFLTNHFTIFVIYPLQCYCGSKIIGSDLTYENIKESLKLLIADPTWESIGKLSGDLAMSFFVGGFLLAVITTPLTYYFVYRFVVRFRSTLEKRRKFRAEKKKDGSVVNISHIH